MTHREESQQQAWSQYTQSHESEEVERAFARGHVDGYTAALVLAAEAIADALEKVMAAGPPRPDAPAVPRTALQKATALLALRGPKSEKAKEGEDN